MKTQAMNLKSVKRARTTMAQAEAEIKAAQENLERAKFRLNHAHGTAQRIRRQAEIDSTPNPQGN